jgi:hypothetical protein
MTASPTASWNAEFAPSYKQSTFFSVFKFDVAEESMKRFQLEQKVLGLMFGFWIS